MVSKFVEGKCRLLLLGNRDSSNCVPHLTLRVPRRALSFSGKCIRGYRSSRPMSQYPCTPLTGFAESLLSFVLCLPQSACLSLCLSVPVSSSYFCLSVSLSLSLYLCHYTSRKNGRTDLRTRLGGKKCPIGQIEPESLPSWVRVESEFQM